MRVSAFLAVVVSGLCGLIIGRSLVALQCEGNCDLAVGTGAVVGSLVGSVGVAVVVVLVMRAMGDWRPAPPSSHRSETLRKPSA